MKNKYSQKSRLIGNSKVIYLALFLLLIMVCKKTDEFRKIRDGDWAIITKGTYRGKPNFPDALGQYEKIINQFRVQIEQNIDLLPAITKNFSSIYEDLTYRYKYVTIDEENNSIILRYFAPIRNHPLYAGYQMQFVFDIKSKILTKIFITEVPLE